MAQLDHYMGKDGRVRCWPSKQEGKLAVLLHLGNRFLPGVLYTEQEVNRILEENHSFGDYPLLRRELINRGILERTQDGARYWRGEAASEGGGGATARI